MAKNRASAKVSIIVQARVGSQRLPGKVLKPVLDKPLLQIQMNRLQRVKTAHACIVATTDKPEDDAIEALCRRSGISCLRGPENDVLARYHQAARQVSADVVVRITGDCPMIDPEIVDRTISHYLDHKDRFDYVSNVLTRTFPRGMDTEVFSRAALETAQAEAASAAEREHVTAYMYRNPGRFRLGEVRNAVNLSQHRWTVDTAEDFQLVSRILETLYPHNPHFSMDDVVTLLQKNPCWAEINKDVEQKRVENGS